MSDNLILEKCANCGESVWWSGSAPPKHTDCKLAKSMTTVTYSDDFDKDRQDQAQATCEHGNAHSCVLCGQAYIAELESIINSLRARVSVLEASIHPPIPPPAAATGQPQAQERPVKLRASPVEREHKGDSWKVQIQGDGHPPLYIYSDYKERLAEIAYRIDYFKPAPESAPKQGGEA